MVHSMHGQSYGASLRETQYVELASTALVSQGWPCVLRHAALDSVQEVPGLNLATATDDKCTGGKRVLQRAF